MPNAFGTTDTAAGDELACVNLPRPFASDEETFDPYDGFVEEHLPDPGPFLADRDVLTGRDHAATHRLARQRFADRGVYDVTFGYNLARLNLDGRHPDAGFRYARATTDGGEAVLRAEFTPTTEFCPQSETLCLGAFRAWNAAPERHEYDRVRVRVAPMHHRSVAINGKLSRLDERLVESGALSLDEGRGAGSGPPRGEDPDATSTSDPVEDSAPF